jgi:hypothetical protein
MSIWFKPYIFSLPESLWAVSAGLEEDSVLLSVTWIQGMHLGFYIKV